MMTYFSYPLLCRRSLSSLSKLKKHKFKKCGKVPFVTLLIYDKNFL